jgi:hypothetical protein
MTSPARTSISALPRGHEFAPAAFSLSPEQVASYLEATGDHTPYGDALPPLAAVALGLAALQEQLWLPDGALHTGQEVEQLAAMRAGDALRLTGRVAQRSERQGMMISVIEFEVSGSSGPAVRARTTIMAPAAAA